MSGLGHIGELQIIDDLQKNHNFEIYLPLKDKGLDFIGLKNNRSIQVQVKTSKLQYPTQKRSYYWIDLHKNKMVYSKNTFYIFVLFVLPRRRMMGKRKNYLIIPSLDLKKMISKNHLSTKKNDPNIMNIFIYPDLVNKKWIYEGKGKKLDLTKYWNNFQCL
jgi:hypothetical protein